MSDPSPLRSDAAGPEPVELTSQERQSALFAQLVIQQSNLAMMLLGQVPHPESGKPVRDLDAARLFIDQLEMLEAKTKGNLDTHEAALLKQSLMALRLAFVKAVEAGPEPPASPAPPPGAAAPAPPAEPPDAATDEEAPKRFSKKY